MGTMPSSEAWVATERDSGEGAQPGRVNWVSEVAEKYLDMEKTFDDLFQRFTDESHYSLGSGVASREVYTSERVAGDIAAINSCGRSSWPFSARRA